MPAQDKAELARHKKYDKQMKLKLTESLMSSNEGKWYKDALDELIKLKESEIAAHLNNGDVQKTFFHLGIKQGLIFAKELPETTHRECDRFFESLLQRLGMGGNNV